MRKILLVLLIFIVGIALLYFAAGKFFKTAPLEEISFEPVSEETAGQPGSEETAKEASKAPPIDYLAPDFELENTTGEKIKLADYKDKLVVLTFWTTWNPMAKDELATLESYYQEIKNGDDKDIVFLAINSQEDKSVVASFVGRSEYGLPVLLDETGEIGGLYGIATLPATYFINRQGKVKEIYVGMLNKEGIRSRIEKLSAE